MSGIEAQTESQFVDMLDRSLALLRAGRIERAIGHLSQPLDQLHGRVWRTPLEKRLSAIAKAHPVYPALACDPYTNRARLKPRGYAGDAVMLNYIYEHASAQDLGEVALGIHRVTTSGLMSQSVLYRRDLLRAHINRAVAIKPHAAILAVAGEHCRELEASLVLREDFAGNFVALDQDALSCEEVNRRHAGRRIKAIEVPTKHLIGGRLRELDQFDLIYAAGLYDYLSEEVAAALTANLARALPPAGG